MTNRVFFENSIGLLILAGGMSRRMGREKSEMTLGEMTFVQRIAAGMDGFNERIFSSRRQTAAPEGFVTVEDMEEFAGKGPAAGIATALSICKSSWLVTIPCDTPFVDSALALKLAEKAISMSEPVPVVARTCEGMEPLIGIYPVSCLDLMKRELRKGNLKMRSILAAAGFETVMTEKYKTLNINSLEDYEKIRRKYEQR